MRTFLLTVLCAFLLLSQALGQPNPGDYFAIEVVDEQTNRGVPMVELQTTSGARYYTDSAGLMAFYEPGLMNQRVFFGVAAHGYEFAKDGFGVRGVTLQTTPGAVAKLKLKRLNIAQRIYRITGSQIYRDSILLGRSVPIKQPLLANQVTGQDGTLNALYRGKLYWFYGDTNRLSYALGNFSMTGATTDLPEKLDPDKGIDLNYFASEDGFVRSMAPIPGPGVVWLYGVTVLTDPSGQERMLAYYQRRAGMGPVMENGFVQFNDDKQQFEKIKEVPVEPAVFPTGYPFPGKQGDNYIYFTAPYPVLRVKADYESYLNLDKYEAYTCLKPGSRYEGKDKTELDRDSAGKLIWAWKAGAAPLNPAAQEELIAAGKMKREESPLALTDIADGKPIALNNCSCKFNPYRNKYVMIASQVFGATMLGEVYYAEADAPQGPWHKAVKIITHANKEHDPHDFYNPVHHAFLDREGGRVIYLEGSYVNTFSGNKHPTPYYEYNQIMYRLELNDPRLKLE